MTTEFTIRRSELATPATNDKLVASARRVDADLVFLDLEDAVAPSQKVHARSRAVEALLDSDWKTRNRAVRINSIETEWAFGDIIELVQGAGAALHTIVVPKVKEARDVWWVDTLLSQVESETGLDRKIRLEVLIEEAEAVLHAEEIAGSSDRIDAIIFGAGDLSASQEAKVDVNFLSGGDYPGDMWHFARTKVVLAARAAGVAAVDAPYPDFSDVDGYREECRRARILGFNGKWAIHPSQIAIANEVFSPTTQELARARRVVELCEQMDEEGTGSMAFEGTMLDVGAVRAARRTLAQAEAMGL